MNEIEKSIQDEYMEPEMNEALTHPSFSNEHNLGYSNQRLEFLGDAILGAIISEYLTRNYTSEDEGSLTKLKAKLTCADWCKKIAEKIGLRKAIRIGNGLDRNTMSDAILADGMEAVIGAFFLINGWEITKENVLDIWDADLAEYLGIDNPKGEIQEYCQKHNFDLRYDVVQRENGTFHAKLYVKHMLISDASGNSKKEAEAAAARDALRITAWQYLLETGGRS